MTELLGVFIDISIPTTMSRKKRFKTKLQLKNHVVLRRRSSKINRNQLLSIAFSIKVFVIYWLFVICKLEKYD